MRRLPQLGTESMLSVGFLEDSSALAEERRRLDDDLAALRESEDNLRAYEAHLRAQQDKIEENRSPAPLVSPAASSFSPFSPTDLTLQSAWEKVIRARELLEAEQAHLRDDRLQMREDTLAARESVLNAGLSPSSPVAPATTAFSSMTKFTLAPFNLARSVLRGSK